MIGDLLVAAYPWVKALHVISVISWMAGMFYLPRLFVYHAEQGKAGGELDQTLRTMERRLLKLIVNPASIATWTFGLLLVFTPGVIDWANDLWAYVKAMMVIGMSVFHHALVKWQRAFALGRNERDGRYYRMMNEVPTVLMIVIVVMVIVRPF